MTIRLNGEPREIAPDTSLAELLESLALSNAPCAVEINREVVPRATHEERLLIEGDAIEIVTFVGGG